MRTLKRLIVLACAASCIVMPAAVGVLIANPPNCTQPNCEKKRASTATHPCATLNGPVNYACSNFDGVGENECVNCGDGTGAFLCFKVNIHPLECVSTDSVDQNGGCTRASAHSGGAW